MPKHKVNSESGPSPLQPFITVWLRKPSDPTLALMLVLAARGEPVAADCIHGCMVETDGVCEHGHPSWLLRLGFV